MIDYLGPLKNRWYFLKLNGFLFVLTLLIFKTQILQNA